MTVRPSFSAVRGDDPLPSGELVAQVKRSAFMAACARCLDLPWPPGPDAHALIDCAPLVALAVLESVCPSVARPHLPRCVGLPRSAIKELDQLRGSPHWPAEVFKATVAAIEGPYPALAQSHGEGRG